MKRTNCQTDEIEVERKKIKVKGKLKPQEVRTKKVVCDLVEEDTGEPDQICLNRETFNRILDQIQNLLEQPITEENDTERKDRLFAGFADLRRLSKGIAEKKKPKKKNAVPGNTWHDKETGKLTDKANAGSWSLQYASKGKDCAKTKCGVTRVANKRELFTKIPCGRAKPENKCGTKSESMISESLILRWKELIQN
mgnify:FL=1|tara:strand:+ start:1129 stop:1716 length:588 start_codon:yes stop_codon:yes gene_type:complete